MTNSEDIVFCNNDYNKFSKLLTTVHNVDEFFDYINIKSYLMNFILNKFFIGISKILNLFFYCFFN